MGIWNWFSSQISSPSISAKIITNPFQDCHIRIPASWADLIFESTVLKRGDIVFKLQFKQDDQIKYMFVCWAGQVSSLQSDDLAILELDSTYAQMNGLVSQIVLLMLQEFILMR